MGIDEEVEAEASEVAEEVAEIVAEEVAEEVVEEAVSDSGGETVIVVNDSGDGEAETLNDSLLAAETIRAIAREEAAAVAAEITPIIAATVAGAVADHEATMPHSAAIVVPPPSADQDEDVPADHWFFRNRGRK